jgi:hypothetical protein
VKFVDRLCVARGDDRRDLGAVTCLWIGFLDTSGSGPNSWQYLYVAQHSILKRHNTVYIVLCSRGNATTLTRSRPRT